MDSAKKNKATEDSKGKKGCAHTKVEKVVSFFLSEEQQALLCFFRVQYPVEHANVALQKEEPCIHSMHRTLTKQLREILVRFIKPEFLINDITKVDFTNTSSHKSSQGLFIGNAA